MKQKKTPREALEQIAATSLEEPGDAFYSPTDFARAQHYKWELVSVVQNAKAALSALQQQPEPVALAIKTYTDGTSATGTAPLPAHSPAQQDARKDAWVEAVWTAMRDLSLTSDAVKPMNIHTVRLFCEEAWKRLPALQEVPREPVACEHTGDHTPKWDHIVCDDCGAVLVSGADWGIASRKWFQSLEVAKFYRDHGRLPAIHPQDCDALVQAIAGHIDGWRSATYGWQDDSDPIVAERNKQAAIQRHAADCLRRIRAASPSTTQQQEVGSGVPVLVHIAHCYQGECPISCKYGDNDCPAAPSTPAREEALRLAGAAGLDPGPEVVGGKEADRG